MMPQLCKQNQKFAGKNASNLVLSVNGLAQDCQTRQVRFGSRFWQARRLFESSGNAGARGNPEAHLEWFVEAVERCLISLSWWHVDDDACATALDEMRSAGRGGESQAHLFMKAAMHRWMLDDGLEDVRPEYNAHGLRFDLACPYARWFVECGNTQISKLMAVIRNDPRASFLLIPYQAAVDACLAGDIRPLLVIEIAWDDELQRELEIEAERNFQSRSGYS